MEEKLTREEQVRLLAVDDGKNIDDCDQEFYEKMKEIPPLAIDEVDDRVRRAILRFISDGTGPASHEDNGSFVMMGFLHGYMVGRKLKRDIRSRWGRASNQG